MIHSKEDLKLYLSLDAEADDVKLGGGKISN